MPKLLSTVLTILLNVALFGALISIFAYRIRKNMRKKKDITESSCAHSCSSCPMSTRCNDMLIENPFKS
ncbi:MAG TPA: hypothetical protein GXZ66_09850 [Clostridiaceae bacterium]|nr:hypothetical protein [Clostridiaceae bacterium]